MRLAPPAVEAPTLAMEASSNEPDVVEALFDEPLVLDHTPDLNQAKEARKAALNAHKAVRKAGQQQQKAVTTLQNAFRAKEPQKELAEAKKAAATIQASARGRFARSRQSASSLGELLIASC